MYKKSQARAPSTEWHTKCRPSYTRPTDQYLIMIRAEGDPERRPRPVGGQVDRTPHHTFSKMQIPELKAVLYTHLYDGIPRTLNRIGVELWDKTADITSGSRVEEALWELCMEGLVEFSAETPILFHALGQLDLPL